MQRPGFPNVKDNLLITRSNVGYSHQPNVSRSWSAREMRVRAEERLARSLGDRDQERRVLEWCKKNNLNVVRKLPRLHSTVLTARGVNTDKFMSFVEEAPIVEKEPRPKPYDASKERLAALQAPKSSFCEYCHREMPSKERHRPRTYFQSPYECEYCGASNDIDDSEYDVSGASLDSEATSVRDKVVDTIRRGNPAHVIDHRDFPERVKNSEKETAKEQNPSECEEMDILWRDDANEYFEHVENTDFDIKIDDLSLTDPDQLTKTVFLTEASIPSATNRPIQVKMAWDDEESDQYAEISRTIAGDDGSEEKFQRNEDRNSLTSERYSQRSEALSVCLFQENDPDSGMKVKVHGRTPRGGFPISKKDNNGNSGGGQTSVPRKNERYGISPGNGLDLDVTRTADSGDNLREEKPSYDRENGMAQSPIANRSVGLSRVALMRLTRESRSRARGARSSSAGKQTRGSKTQEPRTHSHDPYQSYSFGDGPQSRN